MREESYQNALQNINSILLTHNTCCTDLGLPYDDTTPIIHELPHDTQIETYASLYGAATLEQRAIIDAVISEVRNPIQTASIFFLDAPAGCGKTYTVKTIMSYMHQYNLECLPVAFTGIAASLLPGGRTLHNAFKLPMQINETTISGVKANSAHANYL